MDPWLVIATWAWTVPAAGAVVAGTFFVRRRGRRAGRLLEYQAARQDLQFARRTVRELEGSARIARADLGRITAERSASRATAEQVASARRMQREKALSVKAARAEVRSRRARLSVARAGIPGRSEPTPLDRLCAAHDAVTARWIRYETDPALQLAYPAMTDVRHPATAAHARAAAHAAELRRTANAHMTPAQFADYRDAVAALEQAFADAEYAARVHAGERPVQAGWQDAAQDLLSRSAEGIGWFVDSATHAVEAWTRRGRQEPPRGREGS